MKAEVKDVMNAVVRAFYPISNWAVCPNVSYGLLPWEADVLAVSEAGTVHEVEIKISAADLKADLDKDKWIDLPPPAFGQDDLRRTPRHLLDAFWYAVPKRLEAVAIGMAASREFGVYSVDGGHARAVLQPAWRRRPRPLKEHFQITAAQVHRLCAMRYWDWCLNG